MHKKEKKDRNLDQLVMEIGETKIKNCKRF